MKILFAFYPTHIPYCLGIAQLSSLCRGAGIDTELLVLTDQYKFRQFLKARGAEFDYLCFSVITHLDAPIITPYIEYAGLAGYPVLVGGTWARWYNTYFPLCRGDGETLPQFLLSGDDSLFREEMITADLNALSLPDFDIFARYPFDRGYGMSVGTQLPYYSSRGCPYSCAFCQNTMQPGGVRVRTKVAADLTEITERYHPDLIFFGDAMLPYDNAEWRDSWEEFRFPFFAYIRGDIPKETLLWLIDKGLTHCAFGVESGDERYRNEVLHKGVTDADLFRTKGVLDTHDIAFTPFYMQYTPGETFEIRARTRDFMDRLGGYPFLTDYQELVIWEQQQQ